MDDFDFSQFPDFSELMPALDNELFDQSVTEDKDGLIECPFLPLRDVVLFPQMVMPLFVGRERSLAAINAANHNHENLIVAAQRDDKPRDSEEEGGFGIGTETSIGRVLRMPDESTSVLAQGRRRVEILEFTQLTPYLRARARVIADVEEWQPNTEALMRAVLALFEKVVGLNHNLPEDAYTYALNLDEPGWLADFVASSLPVPVATRQQILEIFDPHMRLQAISLLLAKELDVLELEDDIQNQVQQEVDRSHREHFLREQIRIIQGELGELDVFGQELSELREAVEKKELPDSVRAKMEKELSRLGAMPPMSPEIGIIRTYIDWILDLPWVEESADNLDVKNAAEVLDADHYGLERVKDRILEYIAVRRIAPDTMRSPILCFVGPPGTGKTSLGRSISLCVVSARAIHSSCWMKSTSWAPIFAATRRPPCWKCLTRSKTTPLSITTWAWNTICRASSSSPRPIIWMLSPMPCRIAWKSSISPAISKKKSWAFFINSSFPGSSNSMVWPKRISTSRKMD